MTIVEQSALVLEGATLVNAWKTCKHSDPNFDKHWDAWSNWRLANPELIGNAWATERFAFESCIKQIA